MVPTMPPRSLLRLLQLPLLRLAPDGAVIESTPEISALVAHTALMTEIREDALDALARVSRRAHAAPTWLSSVPRMDPRFRVHGTIVAGELHRLEALLVVLPTFDGGRVTGSPSPEGAGGMLKRYGLTAREVEVSRLVAEGRPSPRIAADLGITVHTVRRHTEAVFRKLHVHNRAELARLIGVWSNVVVDVHQA